MRHEIVIGVDLGQRRDSAWLRLAESPVQFRVRHVERLALGSEYRAAVERARELVAETGGWAATFVVDGTGVGPRAPKLRLEFTGTNIFNHPNWSGPDMNLSDGSAAATISGVGGTIGYDALGPRTMRCGVCVSFPQNAG